MNLYIPLKVSVAREENVKTRKMHVHKRHQEPFERGRAVGLSDDPGKRKMQIPEMMFGLPQLRAAEQNAGENGLSVTKPTENNPTSMGTRVRPYVQSCPSPPPPHTHTHTHIYKMWKNGKAVVCSVSCDGVLHLMSLQCMFR